MFGFLKKKLQSVLGKVADKAEKISESDEKPFAEDKKEEIKQETPENTIKDTKKDEKAIQDTKEEIKKETESSKETIAERKGLFRKIKQAISTKKISESKFDELFYELEIALLENNIAVEVIEKIKSDLKNRIVDVPLKRGTILDEIKKSLKQSIDELFVENTDFISKVKSKKPYVIIFLGINGSGKTTTIAKVANLLQKHKLSCVLAAADTFRAASIEQLQEHADRLKIKLVKHDYKSDPAAVAFDAIKHAQAKKIDVVLIDTAGRLHSDKNLIKEMEKIVKIAKPNMKIFVGESITGNDAVEQAKTFNESVGIDAIVLSKADIDEKGGAAISVSYITGKPILFLGTGQKYEDLETFSKKKILDCLF